MSGSGLVTFFQDFFDSVEDTDYSRSLKDLTPNEISAPIQGIDTGGEEATEVARRKVDAIEAIGVETTDPWTPREWRNFQKDSLRVFFQKRLGDDDDDDDEVDSDSDEYEEEGISGDENDDVETKGGNAPLDAQALAAESSGDEEWDTQQSSHDHLSKLPNIQDQQNQVRNKKRTLEQQNDSTERVGGGSQTTETHTGPPRRKRQRRIPHLNQAIHSIRRLDFLDMYTRDISLDLCRVVKIWGLRDTKRGIRNGHQRLRSLVFGGRMPRCPYGGVKEEDGPPSSSFRCVLSLEVEVLPTVGKNNFEDGNVGRSINMGQFHEADRRRRLRIFLYNSYAKKLSEWMERKGKLSTLQRNGISSISFFMKFTKVPAVCVFPFAIDPRNWLDQNNLMEYCLCIGDRSSLMVSQQTNEGGDDETVSKADSENSQVSYIRLDSSDLEVRIARIVRDAENRPGGRPNDMNNEPELHEVEASSATPDLILSPETVTQQVPDLDTTSQSLVHQAWLDYARSSEQRLRMTQATDTTIPTTTTTTTTHGFRNGSMSKIQPTNEACRTPNAANEISANMITTAAVMDKKLPARKLPRQKQAAAKNSPAANGADHTSTANHCNDKEDNTTQIVNGEMNRAGIDVGRTDEATISVQGTTPTTGTVQTEANTDVPVSPEATPRLIIVGSARRSMTYADSNKARHYTLSELRTGLHLQDNATSHISLCAVVLGFKCGFQTKGGDWMMAASLLDDTDEPSMTAIMFSRDRTSFPKLGCVGDVLCLHRVLPQIYHGSIQIVGKKYSSYVVIRKLCGGRSDEWEITPSAKVSFTFSRVDELRCQWLWKYGNHFLETKSAIHASRRFTLADIAKGVEQNGDCLSSSGGGGDRGGRKGEIIQDRDLTVMVTGKYPFPPNERSSITPCGFARVWDGTGMSQTDPLPTQDLTSTVTGLELGDPPPLAVSRVASVIEKLKTNPNLSTYLATPKALCGRVTNVVIWEEDHWKLIRDNVPIGSFIRLRNVEIKQWRRNHFRSIMVHSKSWLSPLPDEMYDIRSLLQDHDRRLSRKEYNPSSGILPPAAQPPVVTNLSVRRQERPSMSNTTAKEQQQKKKKQQQQREQLGSGLMNLKRSLGNGTYTGKVYIKATIPDHRENGVLSLCTKGNISDGDRNGGKCRRLFRFAISIAEVRSGSSSDGEEKNEEAGEAVIALVGNKLGEQIFGFSANNEETVLGLSSSSSSSALLNILGPNIVWNATIKSVETKQKARFFVLVNISRA